MHNSFGLFFLTLLCIALMGFSETRALGITGILEGKISDKVTGSPLIGVNVAVLNSHYGAATDSAGYYLIGNIRAGVYHVRYSMIGYASV